LPVDLSGSSLENPDQTFGQETPASNLPAEMPMETMSRLRRLPAWKAASVNGR
jgi:hypothetical protein